MVNNKKRVDSIELRKYGDIGEEIAYPVHTFIADPLILTLSQERQRRILYRFKNCILDNVY